MRRPFTIFVFFLFLPTQVCEAVNWPLKLCGSGVGAYLCDQDNIPFPVVGMSAWSLSGQATPEEVTTFLDDRYEKGYTAILLNAQEKYFADNAPSNYNNDPAFSDITSWNTYQAAYFDNLEDLLTKARNRDIVVFLDVSYLGYQCGSDGWATQITSSNNSDSDLQAFGHYLGDRYKDVGNIIWVQGADADCSTCGSCDEQNVLAAALTDSSGDDGAYLQTAMSIYNRTAVARI